MPPEPMLPDRAHVDDVILDYLEGELAPDEASRVRAHLDACSQCALLLDWTQKQRAAILAANLRHLSNDALAEIAEGRVESEGEVAHLRLCGSCRRDLEWARETLRGRASRDVTDAEVFVPERRRGFRRWAVPFAVPAVLALVLILLLPSLRARMAYPVTSGRTISVEAPPFGTLWSVSHEATVSAFLQPPWPGRRMLIYGLNGDGPDGGRVIARDFLSGKVVWAYDPDYEEIASIFGRDMADVGSFAVHRFQFADLDGDGQAELLIVRQHNTWFPSSLSAYRADGRSMGTYYAWGTIYSVQAADLNRDGKEEVIGAGTNNARAYQGATIFILDEHHFGGAAVDSLVRPECPVRDSCRVRVVIPQFDQRFMDLFGVQRLQIRDLRVTGLGDLVRMSAYVEAGIVPAVVVFDRDLHPLSHELSDAMKDVAKKWPAEDSRRFLGPQYQDEWFSRIVRYEGLATRANR